MRAISELTSGERPGTPDREAGPTTHIAPARQLSLDGRWFSSKKGPALPR